MKNYFKILSLLFLTTSFFYLGGNYLDQSVRFPANFANESCRDLVQQALNIDFDADTRVLRAAHGLEDSVNDGQHVQFGFESEYVLTEIDGIVKHYGPDESFGISKAAWADMEVSARSAWIRDHIDELFPETRTSGKLIRHTDDEDLSFLPNNLIRDDTGNLEFVLDPFDTYEDWHRSIKKLNETFGEGSMQGTVSLPTRSFFGTYGDEAALVLDEKKGMFNFYADYDILQKLQGAHNRNRVGGIDQGKWIARNFEHPFLGPMTSKKQSILHSMLNGNAVGQKYDPVTLDKIANFENSYKYTGGTVYRPDILGERRVILEVRDAHKNFDLLNDRMMRTLFFAQDGTKGFEKFKDLKHFDAVESFNKFDEPTRRSLQEIFPNKAKAGEEYDPAIRDALEVARNFALPLREWDDTLRILNRSDLSPVLQAAQDSYKLRVQTAANWFRDGTYTQEQARRSIQVYLGQFVDESGIARAYEGAEDVLLTQSAVRGTQYNQFVRSASIEAGLLLDSFPDVVWSGPIEERAALLISKYPEGVKMVDDVKFAFDGQATGRSRKVLVISRENLGDKLDQFDEDYIAAFSENMISFPLAQRAGHLYTRVGNKSYDFLGSVTTRDYYFNNQRLETLVQFEPDEFMRLRTFIQNAKTNSSDVLGNFSMGGGGTGDVMKRLDNNKLVDGAGHNCTSWICRAPIGSNSEAIHELAGAGQAMEIYTNPGWWSMWVSNYAKTNRSPFVIHFTDRNLDDAVRKIQSEEVFDWDFSAH